MNVEHKAQSALVQGKEEKLGIGSGKTEDRNVDREGLGVKPKSKNALKKEARLARLKASKEDRRKRERNNRKLRRKREEQIKDCVKDNDIGERLSKKERRKRELTKLREALSDQGQGQSGSTKVAIHLGFQDMMNEREMTSLASQIRRAYGANRSSCNAKVALWLLGLQPGSKLFKVLMEKNDGFENYVIGRSAQGPAEVFPSSSLVYLSPDASQPLEAPLDHTKDQTVGKKFLNGHSRKERAGLENVLNTIRPYNKFRGYAMEGSFGPPCPWQSHFRRPKIKLPLWYQRLVSTLRQFYVEGHLTDVSLICKGGRKVMAHGIILYLGSNLVRRLVRTRDGDEDQLVIMLPDFDGATVTDFVEMVFYCRAGDGVDRPSFEQLRKIFELRDERKGPELLQSADNLTTLADWEIDVDDEDSNDEDGSQARDDDLRILQTAEGDLLLVNCDAMDEDDDEADGIAPKGSFLDSVSGDGDSNPCGLCGKTWEDHSVTVGGDLEDQMTLYHCCMEECSQKPSLFRSTVGLESHVAFHYKSVDEWCFDDEGDNIPCPLCYRDRDHHRNRTVVGHRRGRLYKCCQCSASKLPANRLGAHLRGHLEKEHCCDQCDREYKFKFQLDRHRAREHRAPIPLAFMMRCQQPGCDYQTAHQDSLTTHKREKHGDQSGRRRQRRHRVLEEREKSGGGVLSDTVECQACGKVLKRWYFNQFHRRVCDTGVPRLKCEICLQGGFVSKVTLRNHIRSRHSEERPYQCEHCPARYATAMSLSGHRSRKHNINKAGDFVPTKIFVCPTCGKMLTTRTKLTQHIKVVHNNIKEFSCDYCQKRFTSRSNLKIHVGTQHTGDLPHKCSFCDKAFARKDALNRHLTFEHGSDGVVVEEEGGQTALVSAGTLALTSANLGKDVEVLATIAADSIGVTDVILQ